jgi:MFS family permease
VQQPIYPPRAYAWLVVAILVATAILSYTDRQVLSLLVDPMRAELGISDTQISLLMGTAFALIYGVAGIPLGYLADRISRRGLIIAGIMIWSLGTLGCGLAHGFHQIFAARICVGLGEAVLSPAAISIISDYFPPERRGTAVGLFLSGIAMGSGAAIVIGGAVLHAVNAGLLAGTAFSGLSAWRAVLVLIGGPGLLWPLVILLIREPARDIAARRIEVSPAAGIGSAWWVRAAPVYLIVATASLVDNAVGAWAPSLLIRGFGRNAADIGIELGLMLTAGFGGGVCLGGILADRARAAGGWPRKLLLCVGCAALILPVAFAMTARIFAVVLCAIPVYFALSGIVTALGFSAILDVVPNRARGLAMSVSFFLNVAFGAGVGPTAVAVIGAVVFQGSGTLGPPLSVTVIVGYAVVIVTALLTLRRLSAAARRNETQIFGGGS